MASDLKLTIELVPSPCWYSNLRTSTTRAKWDKLRKSVYAQYNYQCGICQASNVQLNCHEIWHYDDENHIQKLTGFIALCPMCHHCKHIGHAGILAAEGQLDIKQVTEHFMCVNQCSYDDFLAHKTTAFAEWSKRNKFEWTTDLGTYAQLVTQQAERKDVNTKDRINGRNPMIDPDTMARDIIQDMRERGRSEDDIKRVAPQVLLMHLEEQSIREEHRATAYDPVPLQALVEQVMKE